jgi:glycosyltransferase involved in cell wall biosynthesis
MKNKNLAILIPKLSGGGAERAASKLSLYLDEKKYNKYIIVYNSDNNNYPYGGKLIDLNSKPIANSLGKIYKFFNRIRKVKRIKKEYNIDTTISLLASSNLVNILSKVDDQVIVSVRNYISRSLQGYYGEVYKFLIRQFYNRADRVVPVSNQIKYDLIENYGIKKDKIKVIYNSYNINNIKRLSKEKIENKYKNIFNKPTIINMGRLEKQKGQLNLIRAFKKSKEEIKNLQLVILGQGNLEKKLKNLISDLNLVDSVHLLGFQNNPFKYISKSDLFVFPSLFEGFPNALLEAMACSVPVISSDCKSGPKEILTMNPDLNNTTKNTKYTDFGVLVPVCENSFDNTDEPLSREEQILSDTILEVIKNESKIKKYSELSYKRVNDFTIEKVIDSWNEII